MHERRHGRVRRIIVLGAGVAGLACALAAARAGVAVELFEARTELAVVPAHVDVVPNLLRDLATLDVARACARSGFAYSRVVAADARGRALSEWPLQRLAGPLLPPALGMRDDVLVNTLAGAAAESGAVLNFGRRAIAVDVQGPCATVHFDRGEPGIGDLLLLATGTDSVLRQNVLGSAEQARSLEQSWWHALVPRPPGMDHATWLIGNTQRVMCVPVSALQAGLALVRSDRAAGTSAGPAEMHAALSEFTALPASVRDVFQRTDVPIAVRAAREGVLDGWHRGRALCVGEAAHTLTPHFGQSAALCVEDAVVLGELLGQDLDVEELLQRFSLRRVERTRRVLALTSQAAHWALRPQADTDFGQLARRLDELTSQPA